MKKRYILPTLFFLFSMIPHVVSALTVEDIIKLKKAGVSEETIQMLILHPPSGPDRTMGTWVVKDPHGKEVIIYTTGMGTTDGEEDQEMTEEEKRKKSWEMLKNLIIDGRISE